MNKVYTYTSTGFKLLCHPKALTLFRDRNLGTPLSLQIAPTSRCNLHCSFCSNVNRTNHEELDEKDVRDIITEMLLYGLRTVEWTGGGDPTLWEPISDLIMYCSKLGLKQGFITNGVALKQSLDTKVLNRLSWVRISMNCLDYVEYIEIPEIKGTLGFSYVMGEDDNTTIFDRIKWYVHRHNAKYVRLVPNCQATHEEQEEHNRQFPKIAEALGEPFFYQEKSFERSEACYWCYFKPFLLHDGYFYPCSSVVLNAGADRHFHSKYRWVHMSRIFHKYTNGTEPFPADHCSHCVFWFQNRMLNFVRNNTGMEDFV